MDDADFEGTLVLEQMAAIDKVEDFFDAIDSDDVDRATALMKRANIDASTIATVIRKMLESDDDEADPDAEAAWSEEIRRRLDEVDAGTVRPIPWSEARRRILAATARGSRP